MSNCSRASIIDPSADRFLFCVVWSPIPVITWVLPFIGHLGIADSKGIIHDFEGTNAIGRDNFLFGIPTRYVQLDVAPDQVTRWDEAVAKGSTTYSTRTYNFFGRSSWNMVILCLWMFLNGNYVDARGFLKTWLPFTLLALVATCYYVV
ncbi:hypothetical protein PC129_g1463 [Phytophthora cactorum]|uniref:Uncharacterized protein n=1 Tax=Phytophthora cactorum TaxID=29920 RepID=A0A8T1ISH2_9STRA|nr:hypothetical protein PC129_g1463 [Phytophthora cactorum]